MERIVWTEAYSVGQPAIDGQHQRLITIVNTLIEHRNEQAYWVETCADTLAAMSNYAAQHFRDEEQILGARHYQDLDEQQTLHRQFRREIVELSDEIASYGKEVPPDVYDRITQYLHDWWRHHILDTDMKYKFLFEDNGGA